jgi:hypothetical protein
VPDNHANFVIADWNGEGDFLQRLLQLPYSGGLFSGLQKDDSVAWEPDLRKPAEPLDPTESCLRVKRHVSRVSPIVPGCKIDLVVQ